MRIRLFLFHLFALFIFGFSLSAFAAGGFIGYYKSISGGFVNGFTDLDAAVKSACGVTTNKRVFGSPTAMSCNSSYCLQSSTYLVDTKGYATDPSDDCFATANAYYCPDGKTWNGTACTVPDPCASKSGQYDNGGNPQITQLAGATWYKIPTSDGKLPNPICLNGCYADPYAGYDFLGVGGGGYYEFKGNPKYNGQSCSSSDSANKKTDPIQKNTPEYDCVNSGKSFGYFNGNVTCIDSTSKGGTATKTDTTTNSDGTTTKTDTKITMNCTGDGACSTTTTTTTTTYNPDGSVKGTPDTKTSTQQSGGSASGSGNNENSSDFCKQNPSSMLCAKSAFSGVCGLAPSCEGDAVQCATATAVWQQKCAVDIAADFAKEHADANLMKYNQAAGDAALNKDGSRDVDIFSKFQEKKQNYFNMSSSCPASNVTLHYKSLNYTIDLSFICSIGQFVRLLMHFAAYSAIIAMYVRAVM